MGISLFLLIKFVGHSQEFLKTSRKKFNSIRVMSKNCIKSSMLYGEEVETFFSPKVSKQTKIPTISTGYSAL